MFNTTTTWTHPLDYVRGRRWARVEGPASAPYCPWPRNEPLAALALQGAGSR